MQGGCSGWAPRLTKISPQSNIDTMSSNPCGANPSKSLLACGALILLTTLFFVVAPGLAQADTGSETSEQHISPYWGSAISQWTRWILYWAEERELDPDLVAAVIRKESIGRAEAEGRYGGIGLMMVMSAENGLTWRPTTQELKQPNINLRWGTGILKEIIRETGGNLINALAAYNGGWEQMSLASTQNYAHSVLTFYAYAIAANHGYTYQESKVWTIVLITRVDGHIQLIQTDSSGHFLAPCFEGAIEFRDIYPEMKNAPRVRVTRFVNEQGREVLIDAWLFVGGLDRNVGHRLIGVSNRSLPRIGHLP